MKLLLIFIIGLLQEQPKLPGFPTNNALSSVGNRIVIYKARQVRETNYRYNVDTLVHNKYDTYAHYFFNKKGVLTQLNIINSQTNQLQGISKYDRHGRIILNKYFDEIKKYKYDDIKNSSTEFVYYKDSLLMNKTIALYNEKNQLIKKEVYRKDGKLSRYRTYEYNGKGDLSCEKNINTLYGTGIIVDASITGDQDEFTLWPNDTTRYQYDYGDTIKISYYKNRLIDKITKIYSKNDTLFFEEFEKDFSNNGEVKKKFTRKTFGLFKTEEYHSSRNFTYYFENDILKRFETTGLEGGGIKENYDYQYEVDKNSNWTSKTTLVNGIPKSKIVREIKYK